MAFDEKEGEKHTAVTERIIEASTSTSIAMAKIKTVERFRVKPRWLFVKITDEDGGVGFVTFQRLQQGGNIAVGEGSSKGYMEVCDGLCVRAMKVSHGHCACGPGGALHRGSDVGLSEAVVVRNGSQAHDGMFSPNFRARNPSLGQLQGLNLAGFQNAAMGAGMGMGINMNPSAPSTPTTHGSPSAPVTGRSTFRAAVSPPARSACPISPSARSTTC